MPRDNPAVEVAVADTEPELVEAEVLVLAAVVRATRGVRVRRQQRPTWVAVTVGDWNELRAGDDVSPPDAATCPRERSTSVEDKDGVGALAADQNIEEPVGLSNHVDRSWAARSAPLCL